MGVGMGTLGALTGGLAALQQVLRIAKRVAPDRDPAIGFLARGLFKHHSGRAHRVIICAGLGKDYFSVR